MDSIEECRILVSVLLDSRASIELISWEIGVVARPNDTIVVLHVLVGKQKRPDIGKTRLCKGKALVISMLGEFTGICQTKQVKLEAKVRSSHSIGECLVDEAALIEAKFLLVGGSNSFKITKYCFKNAPEGCSVIAIGGQGQPQHDTDFDSVSYDENHSLSSRLAYRNTNWNKVLSPLQKLFGLTPIRNKIHSPSESICEKSSTRTIFDGPEGANPALEEFSSPSSNEISGRIRTNLWRRLSD